MELTDSQYIVGITSNNHKILRVLYDEYLPRIHQFVQKNGGTVEDSLRIFRDAILFIQNLASQKDFKLQEDFYQFLYSICQKIWNYQDTNSPLLKSATPPKNQQDFITTIREQKEEQFFWSYFWTLDAKSQKMLQFYYEGKSLGEIRRLMNFNSISSTEKYLFNALDKLRNKIKSDKRSISV